MYYGIVKNQIDTIESYKAENNDLKKALQDCQFQIVSIRETTRKEAQKEAQEYINYAYSLIQNMRNELPNKKEKTVQEIKQLESELQKRKEVLQ